MLLDAACHDGCARHCRYGALNAGTPIRSVDRQRNMVLLRTKGGNTVVATQVRLS